MSIISASWVHLILKGTACLPTWAIALYSIVLIILTIPPVLFAFYKTKDMKTYVEDKTERKKQLCELVNVKKGFLDSSLSNNLEEILHRIRESKEIAPHSVDRCVVTDIIDPIEFGQVQRLGNPINIEKALEVHRENLGEEYSRQFTLTSNPSSDYMFRFRLLPLDVRVKKSGT
eukprot:UN22459